MKVVSTKIPDNVYDMLKNRAEEEGISVSTLIKELIYGYLGIEGRPKVDLSSLPSGKHELEFSKQVMDKLNAIERMLDLIHINISELYNACTRRRRIPSGQRTLDESVERSSTRSDVWKGFKEEALKLFEDIYNEYIESKRRSKTST